MIKFLDLHKQYQSIQQEIDHAIASVIADAAFIGGKYVKHFEEQFAEYVHAKYCIGVGNGTDALEIAIEAAELPRNSEIIVPGNSFIASSEAVTRSGCKVVFADVNPNTYTLSAEDVESKISEKTSAIIAVHLYGHPCDMDPLLALCRRHNLTLIEDCAQAHGAEYKGKRVGSIGDFGTFSFYPGKNLGAYGDGGAITTHNDEYARKVRMIANHGRIDKYDHEFEGRNSRLDGLQAAILSVKLRYLETWTSHRIAIANEYRAHLRDCSLVLPTCAEWARHVYHLFVVRTQQRELVAEILKQHSIQTGIHYPVALPMLKAYTYLGQHAPNAFYCQSAGQLLSLPIGEHISKEDVERIAEIISR